MRDRNKLGTILIIIGIIGVLYAIVSGGKSPLTGLTSLFLTDVNQERIINVDDIDELTIQANSMNVNVTRGSGSDAIVTLMGKATKSVAKQLKINANYTDNLLVIDPNQSEGFNLGISWNQVLMNIELPEKQWHAFTADLGSGNLTIDQLAADTAHIHTSSGNMSLEQINVQHLSIELSSGNLKLSDLYSSHVDLNNSSGNMTVEHYQADQITFKVSSGNLKLTNGVACVDGSVGSGNIVLSADSLEHDTTLKSGSGNITINLKKTPESLAISYNGGSGHGEIKQNGFTYEGSHRSDQFQGAFGSGEIKLNVRTGSGNFTLN